jgi:hypothetical protein
MRKGQQSVPWLPNKSCFLSTRPKNRTFVGVSIHIPPANKVVTTYLLQQFYREREDASAATISAILAAAWG